jgi:hypothetical protein
MTARIPCSFVPLVLALLTRPLAALPAQTQATGRIYGRIFEAGRQSPVSDAAVSLVGRDLRAVSDGAGRFLFKDLPAGRYALRIERLSFRTREDTVELRDHERIDVIIPLGATPVALAPIVVELRSNDLELRGFYDRRDNETDGDFVSAADIERRTPQFVSDLFQRLPSVRVQYGGAGRRSIVFTRGGPCQPDMYVDGFKAARGDTNVDRMSPAEIAGIEIYIGGMAPIRFRSSSCGAVILWTRRGG